MNYEVEPGLLFRREKTEGVVIRRNEFIFDGEEADGYLRVVIFNALRPSEQPKIARRLRFCIAAKIPLPRSDLLNGNCAVDDVSTDCFIVFADGRAALIVDATEIFQKQRRQVERKKFVGNLAFGALGLDIRIIERKNKQRLIIGALGMIGLETNRHDVALDFKIDVDVVDVRRAGVLKDGFEADAELADVVDGFVGVGG